MRKPFLTKRISVFLLICSVLSTQWAFAQSAHRIKEIDWDTKPAYTRFVLHVHKSVKFKQHNYINDKRYFFIDLYNVDLTEKTITIKDDAVNMVQMLRYSSYNPKISRFVFYVQQPTTYKVYRLSNPSRIVIDVANPKKSKSVSGTSSSARQKQLAVIGRTTRSTLPSRRPYKRKKVVVIDPGHGGKSTGAKSYLKIRGKKLNEKDLLLQYAKELCKEINKSPGMVAYLTRKSDKYVSLRERIRISEEQKGDVFISLHLNAVGKAIDRARARGVEVYYLDPKRLKSESRSFLEKLENDEGINFNNNHGNDTLIPILSNLVKENLERLQGQSIRVCQSLMASLEKNSYFRANSRGIKSAGFTVLRNHDMPAVLLEIGFISNDSELRKLLDPTFRRQTVVAIRKGIERYFKTME